MTRIGRFLEAMYEKRLRQDHPYLVGLHTALGFALMADFMFGDILIAWWTIGIGGLAAASQWGWLQVKEAWQASAKGRNE